MSRWYTSQKGKAKGPYSSEQMAELLSSKEISPLDYVFKTGDSEWKLAQNHIEFKEYFKHAQFQSGAINSDREWVTLRKEIVHDERKFVQGGPFSKQEIADKLLTGEMTYFDFVWKKGFDAWKRIGEIEEFCDASQDQTHLIEKAQDLEVTIAIEEPLRAHPSTEETSDKIGATQPDSASTVQVQILKAPKLVDVDSIPDNVKPAQEVEKGTATFLFEQSDYEDSRFSFDPEENDRLRKTPISNEDATEELETAPAPVLASAPVSELALRVDSGSESTAPQQQAQNASLPMFSRSEITASAVEHAIATQAVSHLRAGKKARTDSAKRKSFFEVSMVLLGTAALGLFVFKNRQSFDRLLLSPIKIAVNHSLMKSNNGNPEAIGRHRKLISAHEMNGSAQRVEEKKQGRSHSVQKNGNLAQSVSQSFQKVRGNDRPGILAQEIAKQTEMMDTAPDTRKVSGPTHHEIKWNSPETVDQKRMHEPAAKKRKPASQRLQIEQSQERLLTVSVPETTEQWLVLTVESIPKKIVDRPNAYFVMRKKLEGQSEVDFDVPEKMAPNGLYTISVKVGEQGIEKSMSLGALDKSHHRKMKRDLKKNSHYYIRDKKWCLYTLQNLKDFIEKLKRVKDPQSLNAEWKKLKLLKIPKPLQVDSNRIDYEFGYPRYISRVRKSVERIDRWMKVKEIGSINSELEVMSAISSQLKSESIY